MDLELYQTSDSLPILKHLVDIYSDGINTLDNRMRTILHAACEGGNMEMVQLVIDNCGLDPEAQDKDGITCMHILAKKGNTTIFQYIKITSLVMIMVVLLFIMHVSSIVMKWYCTSLIVVTIILMILIIMDTLQFNAACEAGNFDLKFTISHRALL